MRYNSCRISKLKSLSELKNDFPSALRYFLDDKELVLID